MSDSTTTPVKPGLTPLNPPERKRIYHFPGGETVTFENVTHFLARPSGSHRLQLGDGRKFIVMPGFLWIELDVDDWTL
jgi:hypothetical protein